MAGWSSSGVARPTPRSITTWAVTVSPRPWTALGWAGPRKEPYVRLRPLFAPCSDAATRQASRVAPPMPSVPLCCHTCPSGGLQPKSSSPEPNADPWGLLSRGGLLPRGKSLEASQPGPFPTDQAHCCPSLEPQAPRCLVPALAGPACPSLASPAG